MKKRETYIYLFFIISFQIIILLYYINIKTVSYVDEIWTYGLANSKNKPFLYETGNRSYPGDGWVLDSSNYLFNRWIDGSYYLKYITVQPNERFDFKNVYDNQTLDVHPPFYYFILHFICSFFPNRFSLWFGYSINILFLILTQITLFKLSFLISNDKNWALINCAFFAFSMGAVNEFIFIRMYAILGFFYLAISYLAIEICIKESITKRDLFIVLIIAFLGFLTSYQFFYFVFALTLTCSTFFIFKKNYRLIFEFLSTGLLCLLLFLNYFPWIFVQAERFNNQVITDWKVSNFLLKSFPINELLLNLSIMNNYILGLDTVIQLNFFKYIKAALNDFVVYVPVWLSILLLLILAFFSFLRLKTNNKYLISLFTFIIYTICLASNTFYNRTYEYLGQYLFSILPFFSIIFLYSYKYLVFKYVSRKILRNILFICGVLLFIVASHYNSNRLWCCDFKPGTEKICEFLKDKRVIYIVDSNLLIDSLIHGTPWDFMKAKKVFVSRVHNIRRILTAVNQLPLNNECILFLPFTPSGEILYKKLEKINNVKEITFVGTNKVRSCTFYMFVLKT